MGEVWEGGRDTRGREGGRDTRGREGGTQEGGRAGRDKKGTEKVSVERREKELKQKFSLHYK